jgi:hypothetical protein
MEYNEIFIPVAEHLQNHCAGKSPDCWGNRIKFGVKGFDWEWLSAFNVALVGLRKAGAPNSFAPLREQLYSLYAHAKPLAVIDLGDIELAAGDAANEKAAYVLQHLLEQGVFPLVFGENLAGSIAIYEAIKANGRNVCAAFIMAAANLGNAQEPLCTDNLLAHVMADYGRELCTLNVLAYQNYLSSPTDAQALQANGCELLRLGEIRDNMWCAEPLLRDADIVVAAANAVRRCDAPAANSPSPNGLYAEEMCRLLRCASFSDKLKACYLGGFSLANDDVQQTAMLLAQLLWHVADGAAHRMGESPSIARSCHKLRVELNGKKQRLDFYQGKITDRWWMKIPVAKTSKTVAVPCLRSDYEAALRMEIPSRWLLHYRKQSTRKA